MIDLYKYKYNSPLFRYMDFTKFMSMLTKSALYFPTIYELSKIDPFECNFTKLDKKNLDSLYSFYNFTQNDIEVINNLRTIYMKNTLVSSWTSNSSESVAMWKVYLASNEGILIKTSIDKLYVELSNENIEPQIQEVVYTNFDSDKDAISMLNEDKNIPSSFDSNLFIQYAKSLLNKDFNENDIVEQLHKFFIELVLLKRQEYSYENEIRVIIPKYKEYFPNKMVKVNLLNIIEEIIVSPYANKWFLELVNSCWLKYFPNNPIKIYQSNILNK